MVPLSERRHRLYPHEIPEVVEGLKLRLETLLEAREDPEKAEIVFKTLHRLLEGGTGRQESGILLGISSIFLGCEGTFHRINI